MGRISDHGKASRLSFRQFCQKNYPDREIKHVQKLLNERPRKALDFATPKESFNQLLTLLH